MLYIRDVRSLNLRPVLVKLVADPRKNKTKKDSIFKIYLLVLVFLSNLKDIIIR